MAEQSGSLIDRITARIQALRRRYPVLDHVIGMNEHYGEVQGSVLAGAVTYFGFLSFFPILALGFAVIGYVSVAYPDARDSLVTAVEQVFPGVVSPNGDPGTISLRDIEGAKTTAGLIGFAGLLYAGLGWLSGLRTALQDTFRVPRYRQGNFFVGKLTDLVVLAILGLVMIVSVGIAGAVQGWTGTILSWVGLKGSAIGQPLVWAVGIALGLCASTLLFFVMYRLLGKPTLSARPLLQGALLGAVAFELLKLLVVNLLHGVGGSAVAPLAIAVTLVVWINYFSRLVLYGASWAMTSDRSPDAVARRADVSEAAVAVADQADAKARLPVAGVDARGAAVGTRFDPGSAVFGAIAGVVASALLGRPR